MTKNVRKWTSALLSLIAMSVLVVTYQNCGQQFRLDDPQDIGLDGVVIGEDMVAPNAESVSDEDLQYLLSIREDNQLQEANVSANRTSNCIFSHFDSLPTGFTGYVIDLCRGSDKPRPGTAAFYTTDNGANPVESELASQVSPSSYGWVLDRPGHYSLFYNKDKRNLLAIIFPKRVVTISVNGQTYTGPYGIDLSPLPSKFFSRLAINHAAGLGYNYLALDVHNAGQSYSPARVFQSGPATPTNLTATATGGRRVHLNWSLSGAIDTVKVETSGGGPFRQIAEFFTARTSYDVQMAGGRYCFRVRTSSQGVMSSYSKQACVTIQEDPAITVLPPSDLMASRSSAGNNLVTLSWKIQGSRDGFFIERKIGSNSYQSYRQIQNPNLNRFDVSVDSTSRTCFIVKQYILTWISNASNEVCVDMSAAPVPRPQLVFSSSPGGPSTFFFDANAPAPARATNVPANHRIKDCYQNSATPTEKRCLTASRSDSTVWLEIEGPWKYNSSAGYWEHTTFRTDGLGKGYHHFYFLDVTTGQVSSRSTIYVRD